MGSIYRVYIQYTSLDLTFISCLDYTVHGNQREGPTVRVQKKILQDSPEAFYLSITCEWGSIYGIDN